MTTSKPLAYRKNTKGFVLVELMLFVLGLSALVLVSIPTFKTIFHERYEVKKVDSISKVEIAKEQYDQESRPEDRKKFDAAQEPEKFTIIGPRLGPDGVSPAKFVKGNGFEKITINRLGYDSDIQ